MKQSLDTFASQVFGERTTEGTVYPVCDALEGVPGVSMLGYSHGRWLTGEVPFVTFSASPQIAFLISRLLERSAQTRELKYQWSLTADFRKDGLMQFKIGLTDKRASWEPFFILTRLFSLRRDLATMAHLLRTERSLYWCDTKEMRVNCEE